MIQFIDALAIFFIIAMATIGFRRGLVEELGRLLGIIFATVLALRLYVGLGSFLLNWISMNVWLLFILSFILIFIIVLLLARIITKLIHFLFLSRSTKWTNRFIGIVFGTAKGILVVMIFFWIFELIPNQEKADIVNQQSIISQRLVHIRKSIVSTFNLSDHVEKGEKTIRELLNSMENTGG